MKKFNTNRVEYVHQFNEYGLAVVKSYGNFGIINTAGEWMLPALYKSIWDFTDGMAIVCSGALYGAINTDCELVIEERFHALTHFFDDRSAFVGDEKKWGFIDKTGTVIIAPTYTRVGRFSEGKCAVIDSDSGQWMFIDQNGNRQFDHTFKQAMSFTHGFAAVMTDSEWCFINHDGEFLKF